MWHKYGQNLLKRPNAAFFYGYKVVPLGDCLFKDWVLQIYNLME